MDHPGKETERWDLLVKLGKDKEWKGGEGDWESWEEVVLQFFCSWDPFPPLLGCLPQPSYEDLYLILLRGLNGSPSLTFLHFLCTHSLKFSPFQTKGRPTTDDGERVTITTSARIRDSILPAPVCLLLYLCEQQTCSGGVSLNVSWVKSSLKIFRSQASASVRIRLMPFRQWVLIQGEDRLVSLRAWRRQRGDALFHSGNPPSASLYESLYCDHRSWDNIVTENINKKKERDYR